jgi:hypothetical protein
VAPGERRCTYGGHAGIHVLGLSDALQADFGQMWALVEDAGEVTERERILVVCDMKDQKLSLLECGTLQINVREKKLV